MRGRRPLSSEEAVQSVLTVLGEGAVTDDRGTVRIVAVDRVRIVAVDRGRMLSADRAGMLAVDNARIVAVDSANLW